MGYHGEVKIHRASVCRADHGCSKQTLQRLRREAGYRTAKDFAEELHIPYSTYSRYERAGEGPESGIPLYAAWAMADELGCSIDLVVGRTIDARVRKLGRSGREMLDDFLEYLEYRERR